MISDKSSLSSRIGWVMQELSLLIERGQVTFAQFAKDHDKTVLEQSVDIWKDVLGCLDLLDAEGAYMLAREISLLLAAIHEGKAKQDDDVYKVCAEGMIQLLDYLRHLQEGYADLPVIILPMLNNLRAAREADLLSEHLVFLPAEGVVTNEQIGTKEYLHLQDDKLGDVCKRLRLYMQKALLGWFRNENSKANLNALGKVSSKMITLNQSERLRSLWWVTEGLSEALAKNKLDHSVAVKMLLGRMEREVRRFGEVGESIYAETVPDELLKNLLYYVGLAESGEPLLDRVKDAYQLDLYLPRGESLTELRQYYTMPGRELWRAVASSMNEEIHQSAKMVQDLAQEGTEQSVTLLKLAGRSSSSAQALSMLGLGRAAELTEGFAKTVAGKAKLAEPLDKETLMQMGTFLLRLEKVLKEYAETGYDMTEQIFATGSTHDPETNRDAIKAALAELGRANTELVAFSKETGSFFRLHEVIKNLRDISGTLNMLEMYEIVPLPNAVAYYLQNDLRDKRRVPSAQEIETVADILTLLEATLSAVAQNEDYLPLLPVGYSALRKLDNFTELDLATYSKLEEGEQYYQIKKKERLSIPKTLLHKIRTLQPLSNQPV